jgi:uncharacterized protein YjbI with pentapeptide repeats
MTNDSSSQPSESKKADPESGKADQESRAARGQLRASWVQTAIAALAFLVAIWAAYTSQQAIEASNQGAARQSADSQLSAALADINTVTANGEGAITGLVVLAENTIDRVLNNEAGEPPAEVSSYYSGALQILGGYLSSYNGAKAACPEPATSAMCFGRGWGPPLPLPLGISTATNQVQLLLAKKLEGEVTALNAGQPTINLSDDELAGQQWADINFGWIQADLISTDLRGANLEFSQWSSSSDLSRSYLQCANLQGAVLRGADLDGADLRGADIQGADLRGAQIAGAFVAPLYGIPEWPGPLHGITTLPVSQWKQSACLQNPGFWDRQPAVNAGTSTGTGNGG